MKNKTQTALWVGVFIFIVLEALLLSGAYPSRQGDYESGLEELQQEDNAFGIFLIYNILFMLIAAMLFGVCRVLLDQPDVLKTFAKILIVISIIGLIILLKYIIFKVFV